MAAFRLPPRAGRNAIRIATFHGDRRALLPLFALADDSGRQIHRVLGHGEILVATVGLLVIGHIQLVDGAHPGTFEIGSMAVQPLYQNGGIGRKLIAAAARQCRARRGARLRVSTAAAATGALRFYQRCGFRIAGVVRDAFPQSAGYRRGIRVEGIPLLDAVTLELEL